MRPEVPGRYELLDRLGRGGGGEVWAVRDRQGGQRRALKVLAGNFGPGEVDALIREAVSLSGLEGLGLPRVLAFGRLRDGRPYLVRELVEGESLEDLIVSNTDPIELLSHVARAADVLTSIHRAGLLHGDIKPANAIVTASGEVSLVDLGLAAPWRDGGAMPEGLTPHYAAPELFSGRQLTARSEVYSLGVIVREIVETTRGQLDAAVARALGEIVERATQAEPSARHPSVDELGSALRRAVRLPARGLAAADERWPVEGIDAPANALIAAIGELEPGRSLVLRGPEGSGRSTLLLRAAWTLAMRGVPVVWLDEELLRDPSAATRELDEGPLGPVTLLVDADGVFDPGGLPEGLRQRLEREIATGGRLVFTGDLGLVFEVRSFDVPPLDEAAVRRLLNRAIPSLSTQMVRRVIEVTQARPGDLRRFVARAASEPIASFDDLERLLRSDEALSVPPPGARAAAAFYLDHGRYAQARAALDELGLDDVESAWLEARWQLAAGSAQRALELVAGVEESLAEVEPNLRAFVIACRARAHLGVGQYARALELLARAEEFPPVPRAEALAYRGLSQTLLGERGAAVETLRHALSLARSTGDARIEALVASSLATALWRDEQLDESSEAYRDAIAAAERAGDAGTLSNAQINLAGLLKVQGDLAPSMEMLEAAVDTARRSGRISTLHQALLNLANADLYLGRLERARATIETVDAECMTAVSRAQFVGLCAELEARAGNVGEALGHYDECQAAWTELGRKAEAAETLLESVLVAARTQAPDVGELGVRVERARSLLGSTDGQEPLLHLAEARLAVLCGDRAKAAEECERARRAAEAASQREWLWRALEIEADLFEESGQVTRARKVREEALEVLEEIGARLPRDLREVYWNDPRRSAVREAATLSTAHARTEPLTPLHLSSGRTRSGVDAVSRLTETPLEQRLANILAVNSELAGEIDVERLAPKIVGHAADLLGAERGFLLLGGSGAELRVVAARGARGGAEGESHRAFSRSIAAQVVESGEPLVSVDAARDGRFSAYESVHQLMLSAVACVPIHGPSGNVVGALYLETRGAKRPDFAAELPTLRAFADQAAIALENARLVRELQARTGELEASNRELFSARERLKELLDERTARLKEARRELRSTRKALEAHYTYSGLVGTSATMRRVYALIDRVKDTDIPVLITGESGTGKEVVARAIHQASPRSKGKLLGVNCGAIPEQILESELFGHVRGAFTGADRDRKGLFREAEGGSLLLDEIGETPAKMQAGLLRVLQERRVRPVGGADERSVDCRVIFATNRDLSTLVRDGRFREDLYYRIQVVEIALPPLRERIDDIPQLVDHFLERFAKRFDRPKKALTREALRRLSSFSWPGNVRQLENVLLNAWVLSDDTEITEEDIDLPGVPTASHAPPPARVPPSALGRALTHPGQRAAPDGGRARVSQRRQSISQHRRDERQRILDALEACNWNRVKAAELIGMPRRTFYRRLQKYGIQ